MNRQGLAKALKEAAKAGDVGAIRAALAAGANPNDTGRAGENSALYLAAEGGHLVAVQYLCQSGADVNYVSNYGKIALGAAAQKGRAEIAAYLLEQGANPNLRPPSLGATPLVECALRHDPQSAVIARMLLDAGANPNMAVYPLWGKPVEITLLGEAPPLMFAAYRQNEPIVEALLRGGADPNWRPQGEREVQSALEAVFCPRNFLWSKFGGPSAATKARARRIAGMLLDAGAQPTEQAWQWAKQAGCSSPLAAKRESSSRGRPKK
jgi:ankyrin repeat protein